MAGEGQQSVSSSPYRKENLVARRATHAKTVVYGCSPYYDASFHSSDHMDLNRLCFSGLLDLPKVVHAFLQARTNAAVTAWLDESLSLYQINSNELLQLPMVPSQQRHTGRTDFSARARIFREAFEMAGQSGRLLQAEGHREIVYDGKKALSDKMGRSSQPTLSSRSLSFRTAYFHYQTSVNHKFNPVPIFPTSLSYSSDNKAAHTSRARVTRFRPGTKTLFLALTRSGRSWLEQDALRMLADTVTDQTRIQTYGQLKCNAF